MAKLPDPDTSTSHIAMRPKEAARALGIGVGNLWELTNRSLVLHVRLDKLVLYPVDPHFPGRFLRW